MCVCVCVCVFCFSHVQCFVWLNSVCANTVGLIYVLIFGSVYRRVVGPVLLVVLLYGAGACEVMLIP